MADKEIMIAGDSLKVIRGDVAGATRPIEVAHVTGLAASASIVEGTGRVIMSIWQETNTATDCILLDHDQLCELMDHLGDLHALICTEGDTGSVN